jgi:hypothetical protein
MEEEKNSKPIEKSDSPADLARDQHDIFNLYALVRIESLFLATRVLLLCAVFTVNTHLCALPLS